MAADSKVDARGRWLSAPAKVNLSLEVLGQRPDGFHELRTVMLALDIRDELRVGLRKAGTGEEPQLTLTGPAVTEDIPRTGNNLALEGIRAAAASCGKDGEASAAFSVELVKNLPSGAGLGGGSSDCATAFLGALELLGGDPGGGAGGGAARTALAACGSDCAFFGGARSSGGALCEGRGERVTPWPSANSAWRVVVITPDVHLSTARVYGALRGPLSAAGEQHTFPTQGLLASAVEARAHLYNRLEEAALVVSPVLAAWRQCLVELGLGHFCLAGSGASFFGLYDEEEEARADLSKLEQATAAADLAVRFSAVTRPFANG